MLRVCKKKKKKRNSFHFRLRSELADAGKLIADSRATWMRSGPSTRYAPTKCRRKRSHFWLDFLFFFFVSSFFSSLALVPLAWSLDNTLGVKTSWATAECDSHIIQTQGKKIYGKKNSYGSRKKYGSNVDGSRKEATLRALLSAQKLSGRKTLPSSTREKHCSA